MKREEIHDYALEMPCAECVYKEEWEAFLYRVAGKMFAMIGENKEKEAILNLKCNPARAITLRSEHPEEITPGYYMNKANWNSIPLENSLPDALMQDMIRHSYELVFNGLPKSVQKELTEG